MKNEIPPAGAGQVHEVSVVIIGVGVLTLKVKGAGDLDQVEAMMLEHGKIEGTTDDHKNMKIYQDAIGALADRHAKAALLRGTQPILRPQQ